MKTDIQKFKRQRKFFMLLPLFVLPFSALLFWGFRGGSDHAHDVSPAAKLLQTLPEVDLSAQRNLDKLAYYEMSGDDSLKTPASYDNGSYFAGSGVQGSQQGSLREQEKPDALAYQKLQQLQQLMDVPIEKPRNISLPDGLPTDSKKQLLQLENMMAEMDTAEEDPELKQLENLLDKLMAVQHPQLFQAQDRTEEGTKEIYAALPAVIAQKQKVSNGAVVKIRLLDSVILQGQRVPKGHLLYGRCAISNQRLSLQIKSIRLGNSILPVDLTVYDKRDGMEGINVPEALLDEALKNGSTDAVQGLQVLPLDASMETQLAGAGISAAKGLFSKKVKRIKVKLEDGYPLLLKNNQP